MIPLHLLPVTSWLLEHAGTLGTELTGGAVAGVAANVLGFFPWRREWWSR